MSRLKELRKEKGYTQIKMQLLTGIDQSDYSKIENGKRYLTHEQCRRLAIALDTSMDYLAGLTDEKSLIPEARPRKIRDRRRLTAGGLKGEEDCGRMVTVQTGLRIYCADRTKTYRKEASGPSRSDWNGRMPLLFCRRLNSNEE